MAIPENVDFEMRGGDHPDAEMNAVEKSVAERAFQNVMLSPAWVELGMKGAYNLMHLFTFYMSRDPRIIKLLYRLQPYPEYIEMEVVQWICPLKCRMCEIQYTEEEPIQLKFKDFKYAMDQFPNLHWAGNNGLGDPFTNPEYRKMLKYLDDKHVCQEIYMTSHLLKPTDMEFFAKARAQAYVKFSLDGATAKTYESIRKGVDFNHVIENIKALDDYKKKHNKHFPEIHFHYLVMKDNIHECEQYLDMIDGLGINVGGVMYSQLLWNWDGVKNMYTKIPEELGRRLVERGRKLGIPVSFNADSSSCKPPANECVAWTMPYIFPDGTVISCCCNNERGARTWQRETSMGNIFKTPFREIWGNEKYTKLRNCLWNKKVMEAHDVCRICNIYDNKKLSDINGRTENKV